MNKILFLLAAFFTVQASIAQSAEVTVEPGGTKIIKGFMTQKDLVADSSFTWFAQNQEGYVPDQGGLSAFKAAKDSIHILAFGGTWCDDTKLLLPRFYALTKAAGFPDDRITLVGVDRSKKTLHHLTEAFGVTHVPTFIVLKNGKEVGRVVEWGKYGQVDKELGEIITSASKK